MLGDGIDVEESKRREMCERGLAGESGVLEWAFETYFEAISLKNLSFSKRFLEVIKGVREEGVEF